MVGSHLADYIIDNHSGVKVYGLVRWRSPLDNIRERLNDISLIQGELRDLSSMIQVINQVRPDRIFHLAAQSFVPISYESPGDTFAVNVIGSANLLDAVRNSGPSAAVGAASGYSQRCWRRDCAMLGLSWRGTCTRSSTNCLYCLVYARVPFVPTVTQKMVLDHVRTCHTHVATSHVKRSLL